MHVSVRMFSGECEKCQCQNVSHVMEISVSVWILSGLQKKCQSLDSVRLVREVSVSECLSG